MNLNPDVCPCQNKNGKHYSACCQPYHDGSNMPETAEQLMRSRYSAYAKALIDYLVASTLPVQQTLINTDTLKAWATKTQWCGLTVLSSSGGNKLDTHGKVSFIAHYKSDNKVEHHQEDANFRRQGNRWYFVYRKNNLDFTAAHIGRNAICPCGSDKKYKKCCGA